MAALILGKKLAEERIESVLKSRVDHLKLEGVVPKLVVILVGDLVASASYVRQKEIFAEKSGIDSEVRRFSDAISEEEILGEIEKINLDDAIHGVIVQLPLPKHISVEKVLRKISPEKDVDGFTPENVGKLFLGEETLESCTPKGIMTMIASAGFGRDLSGRKVVVIGRSNIVGKPVAALCLNANATVTICHSRTKDLGAELKDADIIIVAVGIPEFLKGDIVPEGATIIDVGIHRKENGEMCGDVDFKSVEKVVGKISPVPGGVGPMTVYSLIENTVIAAEGKN